jgi:multidrug efflux system membrane fusion protein
MTSRLAALAMLAACLAAPAFAQPAIPASAAAVARGDVPVIARGLGTVQAYTSVLVRARVDGTLDQVPVAEGQEVKAGDVLAVIDPRPYRAALNQAVAKRASDVAQRTNAQRDLQRYSNLAKSDFASRQSVDTQQAAVAQAEAAIQGDDAAIAAAQLNLDFCRITAPFDGRVGLRLVDPGNLIHATDQQGILTLTQIHPIAVLFTLPQDRLPAIQEAMAAGPLATTARTGDDKTLLGTGVLLTPDNTIDSATGTIKLKSVFQNENRRLWPGQFVNAGLLIATHRGVLTAPDAAVQHGPDGLYAYRVKPDQTVERVPITVGVEEGGTTEVLSGLAEGDQVVIDGQSRLQAGSKVALNAK